MGLPVPDGPLDVVRAYRDRMKEHRPIPPKTVANGPVFENVDRDDEVDLLKFPVPFLHEQDGGRFIGTDDLVIMRDPERELGQLRDLPRAWCRTRTTSRSGFRPASTAGRSARNISRPASPARC